MPLHGGGLFDDIGGAAPDTIRDHVLLAAEPL
jgi:hypothetical protein